MGKSRAGFTLIELLVSMTILSLLALAILFGFRVGINAWTKGDRALERGRQTQATFDLLSRQLASMVPYYSRQKYNEAPVDVLLFQATDSGLRFVSNFSMFSRSAGGGRLVEYFVTDARTGAGKALVVNETALPEDSVLAEILFTGFAKGGDDIVVPSFRDFSVRPESQYLVEGLEHVRFRLVERRQPKDGETVASRTPSVRKRELLPPGVEIEMQWDTKGLLSAKELKVVAPIGAADL